MRRDRGYTGRLFLVLAAMTKFLVPTVSTAAEKTVKVVISGGTA